MRRPIAVAWVAVAGALATIGGARVLASPLRAPVEIWGVSAADRVEIDGAPITPKGAGARSFVGDPVAMDAPVLRELAEGPHEITVEREGCEPRRFTVEVHGTLKRSIVLSEPDPEGCAIPLAPPRSDSK